ncbi:MAG: iron ABC transporter substrate-binding protein [Anaerolineales bacterium]|nr:iron ABC transporter substrate-binding protein [Anaerolineales bacterium]
MKQRLIAFILLVTLALPALSACSTATTPTPQETAATEVTAATEAPAAENVTVTDLLGRQVDIPAEVRRIVAIGPGALRLYVYAGNLDYVVGVEEWETGDAGGKTYMLANPDLAKLPIIGQGGPNNAPDPEKLLTVEPQVIFSTYGSEAAAADELQQKTGIPVVMLGSGGLGGTNIFSEKVQDALKLVGQIIGDNTKAQAAINFIVKAQQDLDARTKNVADADKPTVYVGGIRSKGAHSIESTQGEYALLDVLHAKNVADETGKSGLVMIDKEKLLEWNPTFIFIDKGGYALVKEDYQKNPDFYNSLAAVREGKVYSQLPYNFYNTNIDTAIADAYFMGKILYPEAFADVDPAQKADEIYQALLGQRLYAKMVELFGGFGVLKLSGRP